MCSSVENLVSPKRRFELESRQGKHHLSREHFFLSDLKGKAACEVDAHGACFAACLFLKKHFLSSDFFLPLVLLLLHSFENREKCTL